ncbi:hypothetical protein F5Y17DRAFT_58913 [Xylariaceae sp. FL0594]|nr:hypothetical protein F5Y17DRAFT_58913 [Xylariaceae sp. FL0594]
MKAMDTALTAEEDELNLMLAVVNLQLRRPERALEFASRVTQGEELLEMKLSREAEALYQLGRFDDSIAKWTKVTELYPENLLAGTELVRTRKRIQESQTGSYDFAAMYEQAMANPPEIDCATYSAPVTVRDTEGRGKGLFTTKDVKAGDLLLCEKAFAYSFVDRETFDECQPMTPVDTGEGAVMTRGQLLTDIVQKLYHSPQTPEAFYSLWHGDYEPVPASDVDGHPVVDTFLVDRIIHLNCFGSSRFENALYDLDTTEHDPPACGFFLLASRVNHACLENCRRSFVGDVLILRAAQDLPAGTELRYRYLWEGEEPYEERLKALEKIWGFTCTCEACVDRQSTPEHWLAHRQNLLAAMKET